ncbi:MAG: hypothetical protein RBU30_22430 [Polyangia bacterium]|jgi:hypothetical protein|nr:hypothetical protein [Polyangia bacterium]
MKRLSFPMALALILALAPPAPDVLGGSLGSQAVPEDTTVTLLGAGKAPRRPLRYRYRAGDSVEMNMDMTMSMGMELMGRVVPPQTMPTMRMAAVLTVTRVAPGGDSTIDILLKDLSLVGTGGFSAAQRQQFAAAMAPLKGFKGSMVVSNRGVTKGFTYKTPAGLDPAAQQILQNLSNQMKQLSTPLPKEPVGLGARWRVVIPLKAPPITMASRIEFNLEALTADSARLGMKVDGWAPTQPLAIPGMGRLSANLKSLSVTGQGRTTLSLLRPAASGQMTAKQTLDAEFPVGGATHAMKMLMEMKMDVTSK